MWPFKTTTKQALSKFGSWVEWFSAANTSSGVQITNNSALHIAAVFACIRNISEDVAKVPFKVYIKNGDSKTVQPDHSLSQILNYRPNDEMTAMSLRQTLTALCLGWGNGYAEIERTLGGKVTGLYPIHPSRVKVDRNTSGKIVYKIKDDEGFERTLSADRILHIPGLGDDGIVGYNVIQYARENLGALQASEKFGASYFGNNTVLGGILKHPTTLTDNSRKNLQASLEKYRGSENANKVLLLEEDMNWITPVIPAKESQFLESRQFSIPEVCRWFRMPPHKIADLQRATFSNIEQQDLEYVKDCLTAWFKRWEQAVWWKLLTEQEKRQGYYVEHTVEGLLRGDIQARYGAYQIALGNNNNPGFMTINEVRSLENLNPIDGGDELFSPQPQQEFDNGEEIQPDIDGNN